MARRHGKFTDHKGRTVSVRNEPKLAEFLDQLSGAEGELTEELTCTVDGGVGGIADAQVFAKGTPLQEVLIALLSGTPELALSNFKLYNASGALIGTGQTNAYAAGVEITLDDIAFTVSDDAGVIGSNTATLSYSDNSSETSIAVSAGANTHDATNKTFGKSTSNLAHAYDHVYKAQQINLTVPTDSGENLTANATLYHALPCFLVNVNETLCPFTVFQATLLAAEVTAPAIFSPAKISTVTKVNALGDYTGIDWLNVEANWVGQTVRHYWFVPAASGAAPSTVAYTVGGTPGGGDITDLGTYNLDMSSAGYGLIDDPGANAVPYQIWAWNNTNAIVNQNPIAFV